MSFWQDTKLKVVVPFLLIGEVCCIIFLIFITHLHDRSVDQVLLYAKDRENMLFAADRLRQSSDDLTRFARTYVITGDKQFKQNYFTVLGMRAGAVARPERYEAVYWNLEKQEREALHPYTEKKSLAAIFASLPFSQQELELLLGSQNNSSELVSLETKAFRVMEGEFFDDPGKDTKKGLPNPSLAIELLHSGAYRKAKQSIMRPIDDLMVSVSQRTESRLQHLSDKAEQQVYLILTSLGLFLSVNLFVFLKLRTKLNQPIRFLNQAFLKLIEGQPVAEPPPRKDEFGQLIGNFFQMSKELRQAQSTLSQKAKDLESQKQAYEEAQVIGKIGHWRLEYKTCMWSGSSQYYNMFDIDPETFGGTYDAFLETVYTPDRTKVDLMFQEVEPENKKFSLIFRAQTMGKPSKYIQASGETKFDESGDLLFSFGTMQDITDQFTLNLELRAAKTEAEQANEAKSTFLTLMSHELRTPLNGVLGMAQLLGGTDLDSDQTSYVDTILVSGTSLVSILGDILDFAKIEAGKQSLVPTPFSLSHLIASLVDLFGGAAQSKGLSMAYTVDSTIANTLLGDHEFLRRILSNLLGNAVKFTEKGEVSLDVTCLFESEGQQVIRFVVKDTGIGIAPEKHQSIFEPFRQADEALNRNFGGTGLGLSIVKQLVEMMGGTIMVNSKLGGGSGFSFELPFKVLKSEFPAELSSLGPKNTLLPSGDPKPLSALLVEDDDVNQQVIRSMLERLNIKVDIAPNGKYGVELSRSTPYDFIFTDLLMPLVDGYQMTHTIRNTIGINQNTPVIALTALAGKEDAAKCYQIGMNEVLTKPLDFHLLEQTVKKVQRF